MTTFNTPRYRPYWTLRIIKLYIFMLYIYHNIIHYHTLSDIIRHYHTLSYIVHVLFFTYHIFIFHNTHTLSLTSKISIYPDIISTYNIHILYIHTVHTYPSYPNDRSYHISYHISNISLLYIYIYDTTILPSPFSAPGAWSRRRTRPCPPKRSPRCCPSTIPGGLRGSCTVF
jgi:hypothetical protein